MCEEEGMLGLRIFLEEKVVEEGLRRRVWVVWVGGGGEVVVVEVVECVWEVDGRRGGCGGLVM